MPIEYCKAVEKEIENGELGCTDGVPNKFWRGFDPLKEEIEEFGEKLFTKSDKQQCDFFKNWTIYLDYNQ